MCKKEKKKKGEKLEIEKIYGAEKRGKEGERGKNRRNLLAGVV